MVIDGAIRDYDTIRRPLSGLRRGVTHRGPYKDGPGEINVPIAIDGMVIEPGDLIVGDGDGVVCVPFGGTAEVLKATTAKHEAETKQLAAIRAGKSDRAGPCQPEEARRHRLTRGRGFRRANDGRAATGNKNEPPGFAGRFFLVPSVGVITRRCRSVATTSRLCAARQRRCSRRAQARTAPAKRPAPARYG